MHERAQITSRPLEQRRPDARNLDAAFARAAREQRELQRLRANGEPWACLDYHPERLYDD